MAQIRWRTGIKEAMEEISGGTRLPLLFFHEAGEDGSRKLIEETLADDGVARLIEREFGPVDCDTGSDTELAERYRIDWTPTFVVTDEQGDELERWVGYLPPADFMAQAMLSKALADFHIGRYTETIGLLEELVEKYPHSELVPEAEYYTGAASYRECGDMVKMSRASEDLSRKFPDSLWTKKCSIWAHKGPRRAFVDYNSGGMGGSGQY